MPQIGQKLGASDQFYESLRHGFHGNFGYFFSAFSRNLDIPDIELNERILRFYSDDSQIPKFTFVHFTSFTEWVWRKHCRS